MRASAWAVTALIFMSCNAWGQKSDRSPWEEYDKLIKKQGDISLLGTSLFGDRVSLQSGELSFAVTDVDIPGNSDLPVAISRSFSVTNRSGYLIVDKPFADWDLEVPRVVGVFARQSGWGSKCSLNSGSGQPPVVQAQDGGYFYPTDYWHGNYVVIPGRGSQDMLVANNQNFPRPESGGPYYWLTQDLTYFSCLPALKNAAGEGFLAITPDGKKYWFDWQAQYLEPVLAKPRGSGSASRLDRRRTVLYATRVEDRFGNWVTLQYANGATDPARLVRIEANDGRVLNLQYNARGYVSSINDGVRTWMYEYAYPSSQLATLTSVALPDQNRWNMDFRSFLDAAIWYEESNYPEDIVRTCGYPGFVMSPPEYTGTVTHPSGASGEFRVKVVRLGRSNVPMVCNNYTTPNNNPNDDVAVYTLAYDAFALSSKRVRGPGIPEMVWNYSYGSAISFAPGTGPVCTSGDCSVPRCQSDDCAGTTVTRVDNPGGDWEIYTFGNSYRYNEGLLLRTERGGPGTTASLRKEDRSYVLPVAGQQFQSAIGSTQMPRGDGFTSEYLRPESKVVVTQDGTTFSRTTERFDNIARPLSITRSSSLGYSRNESLVYFDQKNKWVLGQLQSLTHAASGGVEERTDYSADQALPVKKYSFGVLQQELGYNPDGTLAWSKDGAGNATRPSAWKRAIPQTIQYADGSTRSAQVNDHGWVVSITDPNGYKTSYDYDVMGRLTRIVPPAAAGENINATSRVFERLGNAEHGIAAGHWRLSESTGNARRLTYYDALWRPVLTREYDAANEAETRRFQRFAYDRAGRPMFTSYPGDTDVLTSGTWTEYDALGREVSVSQDGEQGLLTTTIQYLPGFLRRTTNPRGYATTERFQAFDVPTYEFPVLMESPQGAATKVVRNVHGQPVEIQRTGPEG
ncbi:RHS repeat domain-containing protein [Pseudomonas sp. Hp2]|uniref:RHS repeat domain-containing protein n=1 Tax=Pseudomonas sp. Hp2 TaxID=701189 RepID=UPI001C49A64C|nr:RHS repeat domain-containing protein [Pseudomonas sp. Hp2]